MTDKVQKIREEVERLKSQLLRGACSSQIEMETRCKEEAYNEVLTILNSMQEESVSEELEEVAKKYGTKKHPMTTIGANESAYDFKAGAKWQKKQMINKACEYLDGLIELLNDHGHGLKKERIIGGLKQAIKDE